MIEGIFVEISEEEMLSVNGGCGSPTPQGGNGHDYPEIERQKEEEKRRQELHDLLFPKPRTPAVVAGVRG